MILKGDIWYSELHPQLEKKSFVERHFEAQDVTKLLLQTLNLKLEKQRYSCFYIKINYNIKT